MPRILLCFAAVAAFALPCRAEQTSSTSETADPAERAGRRRPPDRLSDTGSCPSSRR